MTSGQWTLPCVSEEANIRSSLAKATTPEPVKSLLGSNINNFLSSGEKSFFLSLYGFRKTIGMGTQTPSGDSMAVSFSEVRTDTDVFWHSWLSRYCFEYSGHFCQHVISQSLASGLFKDTAESIGWGWGELGRRNWQECKTDKTEEMRQGERKHLEHLAGSF